MINAVVFSKDRACQLDLLLTSLERNGKDVFEPVVVYQATTADHEAAYEICRTRFPRVQFLPDTLVPLSVAAAALAYADLACFFTDDSVLYLSLPGKPQLDDDVLCFSLRLGRNTTWCYPHGRLQRLPPFMETDAILKWNWKTAKRDFGYPASVDGHVFRGHDINAALHDCPPDANPNQIEEHLVTALKHDRRDTMASFHHSCLVGIPANVVSSTSRNRHAEQHAWGTDELMAGYLNGWRIQLDGLDFTDVRGAHQEIDVVLS